MSAPRTYVKARGVAIKIKHPDTGEAILTKEADKQKGDEIEFKASSITKAPVPKTAPKIERNPSSHKPPKEIRPAVPKSDASIIPSMVPSGPSLENASAKATKVPTTRPPKLTSRLKSPSTSGALNSRPHSRIDTRPSSSTSSASVQSKAFHTETGHNLTTEIWCSTCREPFIHEIAYKEHLAGQKHVSAMEILKTRPLTSPTRSSKSNWTPDVYARPHIPSWLQLINESNATPRFSQPFPMMDFQSYVSSFSGSAFLHPIPPLVLPNRPREGLHLSASPKNLTSEHYNLYFEECLLAEREANAIELKHFNCYEKSLNQYDVAANLFWVHVPGLRENSPTVYLNDVVLVRQLSVGPNTAKDVEFWAREGGKDHGVFAPGFTSILHHAVVQGINKAQERIILRIDYAAPLPTCNIEFVVQASKYLPIFRSIHRVGRALEEVDAQAANQLRLKKTASPTIAEEIGKLAQTKDGCGWLRRMLFPQESDSVTQTELPKGSFSLPLFDKKLNTEQKKAVDAVIYRNYGILPYLISGPPGTGKTMTLVEAALQLLALYKNNDAHILICAPSDPAADTLTQRLSQHLHPTELFRLNGLFRTSAEVPGELLPYCYSEDDLFSLPPFKQFMKYSVVVTTCRDADILVQARVTNRDLISLGQGITGVLNPILQNLPHHHFMHWKALLIDEAAQATEPEACIPITVVDVDVSLPIDLSDPLHTPVFIMAGDHHQLGPRVFNRDAALSISLFERLFSRPIYRDHPSSRGNVARGAINGFSSHTTHRTTHPAFTNLVRNYRSHPAIIAIPSSLFYHDSLIPESGRDETLDDFSGWKGRRWPVLFSCNAGQDDVEQDGGGWFNRQEVFKALEHSKRILSHGGITQGEICIMSPFRSQVNLLREVFRVNKLRDVNIGPLEAFQGLESKVVIVCTTRTRQRFLEEDCQRGLGIVFEKKRFNVAITRAKFGLFIIGNPHLLAEDPTWRSFLEFCWRNGLWQFDATSEISSAPAQANKVNDWKPHVSVLDGLPSQLSALEAALVFEEREKDVSGSTGAGRLLSGNPDDEDGMWTAGMAAEAALREFQES